MIWLRIFSCFIAISFLVSCDISQTHVVKQITLPKNVLGQKLEPCSLDPKTGFYRDGYCKTDTEDYGSHILCAEMTDSFLNYSLDQGNDLIHPVEGSSFQGLKAGDKWCVCLDRWIEAFKAGKAPPVVLESTHEKVLELVPLDTLKAYTTK